MAAPKFVIPAAPAAASKKLSYAQLRALWIQAGGNPSLASTMAAVALAESGGRVDALNNNPKTGDYSVGPWQINYYGDLSKGRTKEFGPATKLQSDPLANAKAAVALAGADGTGLGNWTTFTNGAYQAFFHPATPAEQAANDAAVAQAKAASPSYVSATANLSEVEATAKIQGQVEVKTQKQIAEQTAHVAEGTQWVQQQTKNGKIVGLTYTTGPTPPKNVLMVNGVPATKNDLSIYWNSGYNTIYQSFTGKVASPAVIAQTVENGLSQTGFQQQLAGYDPKTDTYKPNPALSSAPIFKQSGAGLVADAQKILGSKPPPTLIQQALAENWDSATFEAKVRALPQYVNGPEFQTNLDQMQQTYQGIYGKPNAATAQNLKEYTAAGWTPTQFATYLRAQPEYKTSPEYQTSVLSFMDAMGLMTGTRPTLTPGAKPITGGVAGPNSSLVPGAPTPVSTSGPTFTPKLAGAKGLAA